MRTIAAFLSLAFALSSCASTVDNIGESSREGFSKETYIHQYGVTISKKEWEQRGSNGTVVSTERSGVTVSRNYRGGILEGATTYTFPHSEVVQKVELYESGKLLTKTSNYPNGMPRQEEESLKSGLIKRTCWYESGTPAAIEEFDGALLVSGEYRSINNELVSTINGSMGKRTRWDSYGELIAVDEVRGGVQASSTEFYSGGSPKAIIPYADGFIHGQKKTFYQGGEPKTIETWVKGERTGITVVFQNGEKIAEVPYKNGKKHGIEKRFREGNFLAEEITWVQNRRHGPTRVHIATSDRTDWYHQGRLVTQTQYQDLNSLQ